MKQNKTWCLKQPNLDSKLMHFWEAIDLSRRMLQECPACLLYCDKRRAPARLSAPLSTWNISPGPLLRAISLSVFTSSTYFSWFCTNPPPPLWWNRSKDFDASATLIHSNVLKLKNVFLKWITGILHMSLPNNLRQSTFWIEEQMLFAHFCDSMVYQTPSVHDYSTMN